MRRFSCQPSKGIIIIADTFLVKYPWTEHKFIHEQIDAWFEGFIELEGIL